MAGVEGNPYQSPAADPEPLSYRGSREAAWLSLRVSLLILMIPACCNYVAFCLLRTSGIHSLPYHDYFVWGINGIGLALEFVAAWTIGLRLLEAISVATHRLTGSRSDTGLWLEVVYEAVLRSRNYCVVGAIVWGLWLAAFYAWNVSQLPITIIASAIGHSLAAAIYLPVFYSWWRLERDFATTQNQSVQ